MYHIIQMFRLTLLHEANLARTMKIMFSLACIRYSHLSLKKIEPAASLETSIKAL
jgi:hypothetical protein